MHYNILITSAGKRVALIKAFKETLNTYYREASVYTTDMNPEMAPAAYISDQCFKVPRVTDKQYISILLGLCIDHNIGMIVPTIDTELIILSKSKALFAQHNITIIVSDEFFITLCRDKRNTGDFFSKHNIRIPKPIDKNSPTFPLFAKPYDGSLSQNLHCIKMPEELTPEIINNSKLIFMEYINQDIYKEYTIDMYYGQDHHLKALVPRERIEIRAGEINKGRTAKNYIVDKIKQSFEYINGCIGCICMQIFYNPNDNDIIGIEINPRFGGGYPLSYAAGANFPKWLIEEYFLNQEIGYSDLWQDNMIMLRYDDAIFI